MISAPGDGEGAPNGCPRRERAPYSLSGPTLLVARGNPPAICRQAHSNSRIGTDMPSATHFARPVACVRSAAGTSPRAPRREGTFMSSQSGARAVVLRAIPVAAALVAALAGSPSAAVASPVAPVDESAVTAVTVGVHAARSDVDHDGIADWIESRACGSLTCSSKADDRDADGVPDWVEVTACGNVRCARPSADRDRDGIPDYAEQLVCGSTTCASGGEDYDSDGVADWAEFVICGTRQCATGHEDYDRTGVSDADELMACVRYPAAYAARWLGIPGGGGGGQLAKTGHDAAPWFVIALAAAAVASGAWLVRRGRRVRRLADLAPSAVSADEGESR